ncbi:MBL fold metallo-hydrolase [Candidatus Saccharibacteria bacterium]|nr:MBL fold metallo-hydrolase [Candidatus Saccharibacteria bacterium]
MFDIEYKGANTVVISTKKSTVVVDPKLSVAGLKDVNIKEAVEIATEARFAANGQDARLLIEGPGEYGVANFDIKGIGAQRHLDAEGQELLGTIYRIEFGDVRIGLLGNIYENLSDDQLEELGVLDILIIPVGGNGYTLDATGAASLVRKINPKVVIPVHYADATLKYEVQQDGLEAFVKELGIPVETVSKYKIKGLSTLPATLTLVEITLS